jgi:hypothetical protein
VSATKLAETLTGVPLANRPPDPSIMDIYAPDIEDTNDTELEPYSNETVLLGILAGDDVEDDDVEEAPVNGASARIVWSIPVSSQNPVCQVANRPFHVDQSHSRS